MAQEDSKRNFAYREDTEETGTFSGNTPRQAALKAARKNIDAAPDKATAQADKTEIRLREKGTDKIHIYDAWAWTEDAPEDGPEWLGDTVTEANVSKKTVAHLE
ncbi:non-histone chromosomal MC1 family protein [Salinibaculum rarum]|uniref:non-histone chromosomal MC1 family protein n=1 Tax=Salinibaculum rarum TaxID=3058903 RepID=UPI00265D6F07|nr:non-histone chromosomal MC1 family protein [Salinibaculum sp. KK48]